MGLPPLFIKVRVDFTRFLTIFIVILGFLPQKTLKLEFNHSFTIVLPQNLEFFVDNFGFNWICPKFFDIFVDKYRFSLSFIHKHFDKTQVHTDFTTKFLIFTTLCWYLPYFNSIYLKFLLDNFNFNWICPEFFVISLDNMGFLLTFIHKLMDNI